MRLRNAYPPLLPLDRVARAIVAAYAALGEIDPAAADSLTLTPRAGGLVRCALSAGDARENGLLAAALDEAISPAVGQRYVVSRPVWAEDLAAFTVCRRSLTFREPLGQAWHPVPSGFAFSQAARAELLCGLDHERRARRVAVRRSRSGGRARRARKRGGGRGGIRDKPQDAVALSPAGSASSAPPAVSR